jgi:hypothetical protein
MLMNKIQLITIIRIKPILPIPITIILPITTKLLFIDIITIIINIEIKTIMNHIVMKINIETTKNMKTIILILQIFIDLTSIITTTKINKK